MKTFIRNLLRTVLFFIVLLIIIVAVYIGTSKFLPSYDYNNYVSPQSSLPTPQVSGWIAWWAEQKGYDLLQKFPGKINSVSPVWFMVDENLELTDIGKVNRSKVVKQLKNSNIRILPSLGSELSSKEMSSLFNDTKKTDLLISALRTELILLGVDGVDIDLEGIKKEDKDEFTLFLSNLSEELKKNDLYLSITVHAQTGRSDWEGVEGQDLGRIGEIADEVRIMIYDEHTGETDPGSIASFKWTNDVVKYNLEKIAKNKIVIGIPSYGYIWTKDDSKGLQFDEFNNYLEQKEYNKKRENESGELIFKGKNFSGWLSDSQAMIAKINFLRSLGINKFIFWHLGGMDEKLFYKDW